MYKTLIPVALVATLYACGGSGSAEPTTTTVAPTTTTAKPRIVYVDREVEVKVPVEVVKRVEVEVEVTPTACLDAVDIASDIFQANSRFAGAAGHAIKAAAAFDTAGLQAANAVFDEVNATVDRLTEPWKTARDDCKAAR